MKCSLLLRNFKEDVKLFFGNYSFKHYAYWSKNSKNVFKPALTKTLITLLSLTLGIGIGVVVTIFSLAWLGILLIALFLILGLGEAIDFKQFAYVNAWELGVRGADLDEIVEIGHERFIAKNDARIRSAAEKNAERRRRSTRHPNRIRESRGDLVLNVINITALIAGIVIVCIPLLNYFSLAFNDGTRNLQVVIFPVAPTLKSLEYVLVGDDAYLFWRSFGNSVIITVIVTLGSNLMMALAAYPLSKRDFPFRSGILMFFVITMLFSAGIVPVYLLMQFMHLLNTIWSVILISLSNVANMLYFKTFFEGISTDIEEAARLDGASDLQLFFLIVVPMSLPIIGTCCFFTIVGCWNGYGTALLFIRSSAREARPLAYHLYLMLQRETRGDSWWIINHKNVEAAAMLASIVPIILIYPYVVKYIKSGLQLGSVKG